MSEKEEKRDSWGNHCEFFVTSLGLAVGLGNVWRFPYVCYQNGGGTFLIPYVVILFTIGIPGLFLEQSAGQYARAGVNKIFGRMVPLFRGLGYAIVVICCVSELYYAVICGWSFFYLFAGMQSELPWTSCEVLEGEDWHTPDCYTRELGQACRDSCNETNSGYDFACTWYNGTCTTMESYCTAHGFEEGEDIGTNTTHILYNCIIGENITDIEKVTENSAITPAEDYFNGYVLGYTKGSSGEKYSWHDYGSLRWQDVLCMMLVWVVELFILFKGLKVYGKVAYFITLSPYFVLTAFLAYGLTKEGAKDGIDYYLQPNWDDLWDIDVWYRAASQILLSLSLGLGSQFALCSFNNFKNNTIRDAILIAVCNSLTSIYAGFTVFAIMGFLAYETGTTVDKVVNDGIILSFVSYPSAMAYMDCPPIWSFLFFFMLVNLAISSGCGGVQTLGTFFMDEWPSLRNYRMYVFIGIASVLFLCGLPLCANGGILLFTLFDQRCTSSLLFVLWIEVIVVTWFYGINRFIDNIQEMGMKIGLNRPYGFLRIMLVVLLGLVTPLVLIALCIIAWMQREGIEYGGEAFPPVAEGFGWVMELGPLIFLVVMPVWQIYKYSKDDLSLSEMWNKLITPSKSWYEVERDVDSKDDVGEAGLGQDNIAYSEDIPSSPPPYSEKQ